MSFKRDGNDPRLLSILQKRRIKDLLADNIPEDEAKLLANGRFTCLVCSSNPIFDTVNMLSVHRKGNKHKASAEFHEKRKEELRQLIAKRKHDQFLKTGNTSIIVATNQYTGISNSSPYDSRVKRNKIKTGDRKPRINLIQDPDESNNSEGNDTSQNSNTNTNTTPFQRICEKQMQGPVKHESQLKNIFRHKVNEPMRLHPYTPKHKQPNKTFDRQTVTHSDGTSNRVANNNKTKHGNQHSSFSRPSSTTLSIQTQPPPPPAMASKTFLTTSSSSTKCLRPPPPPPPPTSAAVSLQPKQCLDDHSCITVNEVQDIQAKKSLALKYHQLQGSGWKRDWDGKWIKDDQAEFDSDEEPPDLP